MLNFKNKIRKMKFVRYYNEYVKIMTMGATVLNKNDEKKSIFKLIKNNRTIDKLAINTIVPKFVSRNRKGELVKPKTKVSI